jgi:hypothetical protein
MKQQLLLRGKALIEAFRQTLELVVIKLVVGFPVRLQDTSGRAL